MPSVPKYFRLIDPVSPPGRKPRPCIDRETILSLSDGGSVKKDGYAIARDQRRDTSGRAKDALKSLDYFWRRSRSSGAGWLMATGSEPGKVSLRASSS